LALPVAFIQLGTLRQDRLRAQVSKVGLWTAAPEQTDEESGLWTIPVLIRNGSELPVRVDVVDLAIRPWGYERVLAAPEGRARSTTTCKEVRQHDLTGFAPGTIAPGDTWSVDFPYQPETVFDRSQPPIASITRIVVTDAVGYQWDMRSGRAGPAQRVRRN